MKVVQKISPNEVVVARHGKTGEVGEKVFLLKKECYAKKNETHTRTFVRCYDVQKADGTVIRVDDEKIYVRTTQSLDSVAGFFVESPGELIQSELH